MEDLLRSLRNLGLKSPESSQLLELLDKDEQIQDRLAKILSLSSLEEDFESGAAAALMGQDLLQEAVKALLDNFQRSLKRQQQAAEKERTGGVKKIKWAPRKALLARQAAALKRSEQEQQDSPLYRPRLVFDGTQSFCSTSDLSQLKSVRCVELNEAPKRYQGCYLLCRVITPLLLYAGVTFIVDDPKGAALPVSVSHFTSNLNMTNEQVSQKLPIGTIIAIKEPFVSLDHQSRAGPCAGKADHGIRVDSPTDIVILQEDAQGSISWVEPIQAKATEPCRWLRTGKEKSASTRQEVQVKIEELLNNKKVGQAQREMSKARKAGITVSPLMEATVLFHLDAWEAAKDKFDQARSSKRISVAESDQKAASDFSLSFFTLTCRQASLRCRMRIHQASQGISNTDVQSIYFAAANGVDVLDTSDFVGPVTVRKIPVAGRGLVTTRAVEPGELLLCCKAVCPTYAGDEECMGSPLIRLNLENGVISTTSQVRAQTKLIHSIVDRPNLSLHILGLTAGPSIPDSYHVSQDYPLRMSCNLEAENDIRPDVDAAYVDGVLRFNAFGPAQFSRRGKTNSGQLERSTMPHPLPAILNHACLPNVSSVFFSNIVTTRALCHLPAGTEIVHQYVKGEEPLAIRSANLSKHGFQCACVLCKMDRSDGLDNCEVRARIIQGESKAILDRSALLLKSKSDSHKNSHEDDEAHEDIIDSLNGLLDRINATYSSQRGPLRPDLFAALDARTRHIARKSVDDAIASAKEALICVGAEIANCKDAQRILVVLPKLHFDSCLALMLFIATLLVQHRAEIDSLAWSDAAFWAHQCMIGGGIERTSLQNSTDRAKVEQMDVFIDRWGLDDYKPALDLRWKQL